MTKEELDKLAEKYQDDNTIIRYYGPGNGSVPEYDKTMAEVFKDGWNACKGQMMKEAMEETIVSTLSKRPFVYLDGLKGFKLGEKVKIIIVKED